MNDPLRFTEIPVTRPLESEATMAELREISRLISTDDIRGVSKLMAVISRRENRVGAILDLARADVAANRKMKGMPE